MNAPQAPMHAAGPALPPVAPGPAAPAPLPNIPLISQNLQTIANEVAKVPNLLNIYSGIAGIVAELQHDQLQLYSRLFNATAGVARYRQLDSRPGRPLLAVGDHPVDFVDLCNMSDQRLNACAQSFGIDFVDIATVRSKRQLIGEYIGVTHMDI